MDVVTILIIALAGTLTLFFLSESKVVNVAESWNTKSKNKFKRKKKKQKSKSTVRVPTPQLKPKPDSVVFEHDSHATPFEKKLSKKARQRMARRLRKQEEKEKEKEEEEAKASRKNTSKNIGSKQQKLTDSQFEMEQVEDEGACIWEDVTSIRIAKKQSPKKQSEGIVSQTKGYTIKKTIDVGEKIPALVGRGGSTIRAIRQATGVNIKVPRRDQNSTVVTVLGSEHGVVQALEIIAEKISAGGQSNVDDRESATITIKQNEVRFVIGRGGSNIRLIQEKCGASLNVSRTGPPTITIRGDQHQIKNAKSLIARVIENCGIIDGVQETIPLQSGQGRIIIGHKGVTISTIKDKTGAKIKVNDNIVEIFGKFEQVQAASNEINLILADYVTDTLALTDNKQRGTLVGPKGTTIREIQSKSGASIKVKKSSLTVYISGSKNSVAKAKQLIHETIDAPRTFPPLGDDIESIIIDVRSCVARVIGRSGATMRKIQSDTGTKLSFLGHECRISGSKEQIKSARRAVQAILDSEAKRETNRKHVAKKRVVGVAAAVSSNQCVFVFLRVSVCVCVC